VDLLPSAVEMVKEKAWKKNSCGVRTSGSQVVPMTLTSSGGLGSVDGGNDGSTDVYDNGYRDGSSGKLG